MNRYILVSKEIKKGDYENDSHSLHEYFELGWEVATTHLDTKFSLFNNKFNKSDIIVTHSGREFFYENLFDKVITWNEFEKINTNQDIIIDMVENTLNYFFHSNQLIDKSLIWTDEKIDDSILYSFNYSDLNPNNKFVCLVYRKRKHDLQRNINDDYFNGIINYVKSRGLDIYIVGYGAEKFADNEHVFYVDLRDWATLINNEKCELIITTMTGPTNLINFCGQPKTNVFIIDITSSRNANSRIVMGDCLNFRKMNYNFLPYKNINSLIEKIEKIINNE